MSGGSYNYLYSKSAYDLINIHSVMDDMERMSARLASLGYANDAARETEELIVILRQVETRLQVRLDRLCGIWHAVEWWDSCDSSEDCVKDELLKYRQNGVL